MRMTFYFLMTVISIYQTQAYRYAIFEQIPKHLCNNLTCKGDVKHTACNSLTPSSRCSDFRKLDMTRTVRHIMLLGHNGIRNKFAGDFGIGNMNLLHWSKELQRMSQHFLTDCIPQNDVCDFLVEKTITIGNNYFFSKSPARKRWAGRAVRSWYYELGFDIKDFHQFKQARENNASIPNFIQMIWPTTEFVGCAGAQMFNGYMATCYYHPDITEGWADFDTGAPCSRCAEGRPTCSREFTKLCGLDFLNMGSAGRLYVCKCVFVICVVLSLGFIIFNTIMLI